jgi:hypothetical protein
LPGSRGHGWIPPLLFPEPDTWWWRTAMGRGGEAQDAGRGRRPTSSPVGRAHSGNAISRRGQPPSVHAHDDG